MSKTVRIRRYTATLKIKTLEIRDGVANGLKKVNYKTKAKIQISKKIKEYW